MGWITTVQSFIRAKRRKAHVSDLTLGIGAGETREAEHYAPLGDDSVPLLTDFALSHKVASSGRVAVSSYLDPINPPKAKAGDKRIYARETGAGLAVTEIWLKSDGSTTLSTELARLILSKDGSITADNSNGGFGLMPNGDFIVNGVTITSAGEFSANGVTIDTSGAVDIPSSLKLASKELAGHTHNINSGSSAPGPTGGNN